MAGRRRGAKPMEGASTHGKAWPVSTANATSPFPLKPSTSDAAYLCRATQTWSASTPNARKREVALVPTAATALELLAKKGTAIYLALTPSARLKGTATHTSIAMLNLALASPS